MFEDPEKAQRSWNKLLKPEFLRMSLIRCSAYLMAYELLIQALIDQPKGFFAEDYTNKGEPVESESYKTHVLSLDSHPYRASANWFRDMGAITDADVDRLADIRQHRAYVAHKVPKIVLSADEDMRDDLLWSIVELVAKIDTWWIREIEMPISGDFDNIDPEDSPPDVFSMRMFVLDLLIDVALGDATKLANAAAAYARTREPK